MARSIAIALLTACPAQAQDPDRRYCTAILHDGTITISTHETEAPVLILKTERPYAERGSGLVLTLANGGRMAFENQKVYAEEAGNGLFVISSSVVLRPEHYRQLSGVEIESFRLGGTTVSVDYKEPGENLRTLILLSENP